MARLHTLFQTGFGLRALVAYSLSTGLVLALMLPCQAARNAAPVKPFDTSQQMNFQGLVYGGSSSVDVERSVGRPPDDIVRSEQMYPVIVNYYYYNEGQHSGAATVFVFENNLLVGLQYKSATNQLIDLTYILPDNGDRLFNTQTLGGFQSYYFDPRFYEFRH